MLGKLGLEPPVLSDVEYERVEELAGLAELRARVASLLAELPAEARDALRLRVLEERPYPEVAAALGIAEPAARARVSRALRGLAAELEAREERGMTAPGESRGGGARRGARARGAVRTRRRRARAAAATSPGAGATSPGGDAAAASSPRSRRSATRWSRRRGGTSCRRSRRSASGSSPGPVRRAGGAGGRWRSRSP